MHDEINSDWSGIEFKDQDEVIFFPSTIQVPLHIKFKTRKSVTCSDPKYTVMVKGQKSVSVLNWVWNVTTKTEEFRAVNKWPW